MLLSSFSQIYHFQPGSAFTCMMGLSQSFCLSSVILLFRCSISRCRNSMLSSGGGGCCGCCWPPALPPPPLLGPPPTPAADAILLDEVVILTDVAQQGVLADVRVDDDEVLDFSRFVKKSEHSQGSDDRPTFLITFTKITLLEVQIGECGVNAQIFFILQYKREKKRRCFPSFTQGGMKV